MGEDLADVVAAAAEDGEDRVSDGAFQRASREAAVGFHVADLGLDGAAAAEVGDEFWRQAAGQVPLISTRVASTPWPR